MTDLYHRGASAHCSVYTERRLLELQNITKQTTNSKFVYAELNTVRKAVEQMPSITYIWRIALWTRKTELMSHIYLRGLAVLHFIQLLAS